MVTGIFQLVEVLWQLQNKWGQFHANPELWQRYGKQKPQVERLRELQRAVIIGNRLRYGKALLNHSKGDVVIRDNVTDDVDAWRKLLAGPDHAKVKPYSYRHVVDRNEYLAACLRFPPTWGEWEWQHSVPPPDPQNYKDAEGVLMTFPFNRAYTVARPEAFDAFRGTSGLAIVRHYPLNENATEGKLGYFVSDVERAGPFCMLAEARAVAYGDPRFIGYLSAQTFNRGFPEFVRAFNAAFLALPALPSRVVSDACDNPAVVVRRIDGGRHGVWLAVVNVGLGAVEASLKLPVVGRVSDAATGEVVAASGGRLRLRLGPCQLRALRVVPKR